LSHQQQSRSGAGSSSQSISGAGMRRF
jgi:hypothetical protein